MRHRDFPSVVDGIGRQGILLPLDQGDAPTTTTSNDMPPPPRNAARSLFRGVSRGADAGRSGHDRFADHRAQAEDPARAPRATAG